MVNASLEAVLHGNCIMLAVYIGVREMQMLLQPAGQVYALYVQRTAMQCALSPVV